MSRSRIATILSLMLIALLALPDISDACCRKKKKPPKPKCPAEAGGSMGGSSGSGPGMKQLTVTFANASQKLLSSNGMPLTSGQKCACLAGITAAQAAAGVTIKSVGFPTSYPTFSASSDSDTIDGAEDFGEAYETMSNKNWTFFVFDTPTGGTIPSGVDFDLQVTYEAPDTYDWDDLTVGQGMLAMLMDDNGTVEIEDQSGSGTLSLSEFTSGDPTDGAIFKTKINSSSESFASQLALAAQICAQQGADCDFNEDGYVGDDDLRAFIAPMAASADCNKQVRPKQPVQVGTLE